MREPKDGDCVAELQPRVADLDALTYSGRVHSCSAGRDGRGGADVAPVRPHCGEGAAVFGAWPASHTARRGVTTASCAWAKQISHPNQ